MRGGVLVLALLMAACGSTSASATSGSSSGSSSASGSSASSSSATCGPTGARTLAAGGQARVYAAAGAVYGCSVRTHRITRLGQSRRCIGSSRAGPAAVAGQLAAYGLQSCGVDTGTAEVVVRRLTDGVIVRTLSATVGARRPESYSSVASIVARPDGAAAWIGRLSSIISHRTQLQVIGAGAGGSERVLGSGSAIAADSLALHGTRLTWKDGGRSRSANLR